MPFFNYETDNNNNIMTNNITKNNHPFEKVTQNYACEIEFSPVNKVGKYIIGCFNYERK